MSILEKIRISSDSEDEFPSEREQEFSPENDPENDPDNADRDPAPGEAPDRPAPRAASRAARAARDVPRVTKKVREDAQEELETFLQAIALLWGMQAPPCGEVLEQTSPDIAEKVVKLLARNPKWLMRVRDGGFLGDVVKLALAFKPLATVTWEYYRTPSGGDADGVTFDPARFPAYGAG